MKIHQIISEREVIKESRFSWLDDTFKWLKGFTKAGKEAERIAKELEYLAPGIDKAAERYADMVTKAREEFKKPPSIDFFLRRTVPNWTSRVPDEQEAIKQALMNATKSKIAEREAAKAAAKNPPTPTTPPAPAPGPAPAPNKQPKQAKQKQQAQPSPAQVQAAEDLVKTKMSKSNWLQTIILGAGFVDITQKSVSDYLYYAELHTKGELTDEEATTYTRAVIEQWVLKLIATGFLAAGAAKILGTVGKAVGVSPKSNGIPFFKTIVSILKHVWPERVTQMGGILLGQASAVIIAHWLQNNEEHQKMIAWLIWDYIDPGVVYGWNLGKRVINANVSGAKLEMTRLLDEIEADKQKNNAPAQPPAAPAGGQSGSEVVPTPGAQQTPAEPAAPATQPRVVQQAPTNSDDEREAAWQRLMQMK